MCVADMCLHGCLSTTTVVLCTHVIFCVCMHSNNVHNYTIVAAVIDNFIRFALGACYRLSALQILISIS